MTKHLIRKKKDHLAHISRTHLPYFIISIIALAGMGFPILVGGDHFESHRFYQPVWPLLILPSMYFFARLHKRILALNTRLPWKQLKYFVLILVLILFSLLHDSRWYSLDNSGLVREFSIAEGGRKLGKTLNQMFQTIPLPTVGVITSGGIKYSYSGPVNDLMGLNNIAMAHHPGDRKGIKNHAAFSKEIFYLQEPEIILPGIFAVAPIENLYENSWAFWILKGLLYDPPFEKKYKLAAVKRLGIEVNKYIFAFYRNDYLESIKKNKAFVIKVIDH